MIVEVSGSAKAINAADWLKNKGWKFDLTLACNDPFSGRFNFTIPDRNHALLFKLCWV